MASRASFADHLGEVPLFALCTKRELRELAHKLEERSVPAGREIVRQGERAAAFFVILEGTAKVVRNGRKIAELGPGDFFGELALLDPATRTATVVATSPMELAMLSRKYFSEVVLTKPGVGQKVMVAMARRVRELGTKGIE